MNEVSTLFWDVGGVLLTNGWDRASRGAAVEQFGLAQEEFDERHELVVTDFEIGRISLDEYLRCTVFYQPRSFGMDEFREFMFARSQAHRATLAVAERLADSGRYLMATLNNESRELNVHRIEQFGLRRLFSLFLSSGFVGAKKPEEAIYRLALHITQREPENCVFIDDRALNLERATALGIHTIRHQNAEQLRDELYQLGVEGH